MAPIIFIIIFIRIRARLHSLLLWDKKVKKDQESLRDTSTSGVGFLLSLEPPPPPHLLVTLLFSVCCFVRVCTRDQCKALFYSHFNNLYNHFYIVISVQSSVWFPLCVTVFWLGGHWSLRSLIPEVIDPRGHWSPRSLISEVIDPRGHWSPRSLIPEVIDPRGHWSPRSLISEVIDPWGHWSLRSLIHFSEPLQITGGKWSYVLFWFLSDSVQATEPEEDPGILKTNKRIRRFSEVDSLSPETWRLCVGG